VLGDVRDRDTLDRAVEGVGAIVHLGAAFRGVEDAEVAAVNRTATIELGRSALAAGVRRFLLARTNLVYGPGHGRPAREDDPPNPSHVYPAGKAAAEHALKELHREHGLGPRIVRLAFVYGDDDPHLGESLMWARGWAAHKRLHLVHHADVAQALLRALRAEGIDGATFNVADDAPVSALELLQRNSEPIPPGSPIVHSRIPGKGSSTRRGSAVSRASARSTRPCTPPRTPALSDPRLRPAPLMRPRPLFGASAVAPDGTTRFVPPRIAGARAGGSRQCPLEAPRGSAPGGRAKIDECLGRHRASDRGVE
jgi:nucleoside-diphosphate-sugar epimerase